MRRWALASHPEAAWHSYGTEAGVRKSEAYWRERREMGTEEKGKLDRCVGGGRGGKSENGRGKEGAAESGRRQRGAKRQQNLTSGSVSWRWEPKAGITCSGHGFSRRLNVTSGRRWCRPSGC